MIVTLTSHPSLDRILMVPDVSPGAVNWSAGSILEPGGDGVNLSRVLLARGVPTTAVLPIGGGTGRALALLLTDALVPFVPVPVSGAMPVSTTIVEPAGTATTFHESAPALCADEAFALLACTDDQVQDASWLAVCGVLGPGLPDDFYATVIRRAHTYGTQVAVAAHGEALRHALAAGPDLVSLNRADLAHVLGRDLSTPAEVRCAGQDLVRRGIPTVIITLETDGAMLITDHEYLHARATAVQPVCALGAGPALLAGVLHTLDQGASAVQALTTGVAWAAATVQQPGTQPPSPAQTAAVTVTLDRGSDATPLRAA